MPEARFDLGESRSSGSGGSGSKKLAHARRIHVLEGEWVLLPWSWPHAPRDAPTRVSSRHFFLAEVADSAEMDPLAPSMLRDLTAIGKDIAPLTARDIYIDDRRIIGPSRGAAVALLPAGSLQAEEFGRDLASTEFGCQYQNVLHIR